MLTDRVVTIGRATEILRDLVRIESVNPFFPGGSRGESEMTAYVDRFFRSLRLEPTRQVVLPGRENIWAQIETPNAKGTILLESHMDTVTLEPVGTAMLEPVLANGRMTGRGSCDTKASLAGMLAALESLMSRRKELAVNVIVLGSVDEEYLMRGILAFAEQGLPIDAAIVGEPTGLNVVRAHKGLVRWTIETHGKSAHTSRPENGDNAIYQMTEVIAALREELEPRLAARSHPLLGRPTITVATIHGGLGVNIVPDQCAITIDRRTLPSEDVAAVIVEVESILAELRRRRPHVRVEIGAPFASISGLDTASDVPFVRLAVKLANQHGGQPTAIGVPYGTNAFALAAKGIPTIVLGPGDISQAHSADEWVDLSQVERAAELYAAIALNYTGE